MSRPCLLQLGLRCWGVQQGLYERVLITSTELDGVPRLERADCGFVDTADDEVCQRDTAQRCRLLEQSLLFFAVQRRRQYSTSVPSTLRRAPSTLHERTLSVSPGTLERKFEARTERQCPARCCESAQHP
jgi:hypothetical protein